MKIFQGILLAVLLGVFAWALIGTARQTSLVYDEVIYAPAGVLYWTTGDFRVNQVHPPLQKLISALPLLTQNLTIPALLEPALENEWRLGYRIFFQSPTPARHLVFLARLPTIVISFVLALLLFLVCAREYEDRFPALLTTAVFIFDPLVLGNGSLAMNDMFVTFFIFSAVFSFKNWLSTPTARHAIFCGLLTGAAIASKLSGLLLAPLFLWMMIQKRKNFSVSYGRGVIVIGAMAVITVLGSYGFHLTPALNVIFTEAKFHAPKGSTGFLLGPIDGSSTWFYYPIAMIVKTPLPLLALWIGSIYVLFSKKKLLRPPASLCLAPILIFWLAAMLSRNHFGVRYLLPTLPFLALLVGNAYQHLAFKKERVVFVGLGVWLVVEALRIHPHQMAYFNQLIGGPSNGYKWLDGSNQDWGQDLPALKKYLDQQNPKPAVCMGYWGSNQPEAWGIEYQDVYSPAITNAFRHDRVNPVNVERELLVVSATLLANPSTKYTYGWLEAKTPIAFLGNTLFVYDITDDIESTLNLGHIYGSMGRGELANRQLGRAVLIRPGSVKIGAARELMGQRFPIQNGIVSPGEEI